MIKSVTKSHLKSFLLPLIITLVLLLSTRFTAWPEMTAWPYLINEGWMPYKDIAIAHTPLLLFVLSGVYKLFGNGILQLQIFTWAIVFLTTGLVYFVTLKIHSKRISLVASLIFPFLFIAYEGNGLWFDLVLAPLFLIIYYLFVKEKYVKAGLLAGISLFVKQTAIWIFIPISLILISTSYMNLGKLESKIVPFYYGVVLVVLCAVVTMHLLGILPYFTHWAIEFGILTLPKLSGQVDLPNLGELAKTLIPFSTLVLMVLLTKQRKYTELLLWATAASMGVFPRFGLFHFLPAIPFLSIGISLVVQDVLENKIKKNKTFVILLLFLSAVFILRSVSRNISSETRFYDEKTQQVSQVVTELTSNNQQIYVINYWDNLYALTKRLPAVKPLIPYLPWYLKYDNLGDFVALEVRANLPEVIVIGPAGEEYDNDFMNETINKYYYLHTKIDDVTIYTLY